jgi:hypothetical protein
MDPSHSRRLAAFVDECRASRQRAVEVLSSRFRESVLPVSPAPAPSFAFSSPQGSPELSPLAGRSPQLEAARRALAGVDTHLSAATDLLERRSPKSAHLPGTPATKQTRGQEQGLSPPSEFVLGTDADVGMSLSLEEYAARYSSAPHIGAAEVDWSQYEHAAHERSD